MKPSSLFLTGIFLLLAFSLLPALCLGENLPFFYNDVLDSNHVLYSMMGGWIEGMNLQDGIYPGIMSGLPESALPSRFSLLTLIYTIFSPFTAIVVNMLLIRMLAFTGMYLLFRKLFTTNEFMLFPAALAFSMIPFFPYGGMSVAGLPLLAWAISELTVNLRNWRSWLAVLIFPFYSNLVWVGIIYLIILGIIQIFLFIRNRRTPWSIWLCMVMLSMGYLLSEYRVIHDTIVNPQYISQRVEFSMASFMEPVTIPWAVWIGWQQFLHGQEHALSVHFPVIPLLALFAMVTWFFSKTRILKHLFWLFLVTGLLSLLYGLYYWTPLTRFIESFSLLRLIDLSRVYFLHPVLWYMILGFALIIFVRINRITRLLSYLTLVFQFFLLFYSDPGWRDIFSGSLPPSQVRYTEFYRKDAFLRLRIMLGKEFDNARFGCLGIYPGIAQMNGFPTIDGYVSNYPLEYKHTFRKIIAKELEKDASIRKYFDHWGSRCYLFNSETGKDHLVPAFEGRSYENLQLDRGALADLGCNYLLSALPIRDAVVKGFHFLGMQQQPGSDLKIYLYRVSQIFPG